MGLWLSWQVEAVLFGTGADRLHPYIVVSLLTKLGPKNCEPSAGNTST